MKELAGYSGKDRITGPIDGNEVIAAFRQFKVASRTRVTAQIQAAGEYRALRAEHHAINITSRNESGLPAYTHLRGLGVAAMRYCDVQLETDRLTELTHDMQNTIQRLLMYGLDGRRVVATAVSPNSQAITRVVFDGSEFVANGTVQQATGTLLPGIGYLSADAAVLDLKPLSRWRQPDHYQVELLDSDLQARVNLQFPVV